MRKAEEKLRRIVVAVLAIAATVSCMQKQSTLPPLSGPTGEFLRIENSVDPYTPYTERRARHRTKQIGVGPIEGTAMPPTPEGAELVSYESNGLTLQGWLVKPE